MKKIVCLVLAAVCAFSVLGLCGCSQNYIGEISVYNWGENISNGEDGSMDVIAEFEKRYNIKVNYTNYETNEELYNILKNSNSSYDVIIPSDYMISQLINEDMLEEINFDNIPNYSNIDEKYKNQPFDPENKYSVPYTWGVVALVYNKTMISETPTGFSALWNENDKGNILMFNNSRDAIAIAIQMAGKDPSDMSKENIDAACEQLAIQKPLLKNYVMDKVFTEMENDQAAIAPYYAGDIAIMMSNNENLDYCLPEEGSNLFIDSMCIPKGCKNKEYAEAFINFMLEAEVGAANAEYIGYATPNKAAYALLDEETQNSELIYPSDEYLSKCYVFTALSVEDYAYMQEAFTNAQAG